METHCIVVIMSVIFFKAAQEFGGTVMMIISLKLVIYQKGFVIERVTKNQKERKMISGSKDVLFVVYIRTIHLKNRAIFQ